MVDHNSTWIHPSEMARARFSDDANMTDLTMKEAFNAAKTTSYTLKEEREEQYESYVEGRGEEAEAAERGAEVEVAEPAGGRGTGQPGARGGGGRERDKDRHNTNMEAVFLLEKPVGMNPQQR
jgi:hypothetical protein